MFTHLCSYSAAAGQVLFLTFGFPPEGVQFVKVTCFNRPTTVAQCLFDEAETPLELAVGAAQGVFRVLLEVSSQVHGGEQQVANFIFKGLVIKGIYGREMFETWYKMTAMLQSGLDIRPVITHRLPVEQYLEGFEIMKSGQCGKVILEWPAAT